MNKRHVTKNLILLGIMAVTITLVLDVNSHVFANRGLYVQPSDSSSDIVQFNNYPNNVTQFKLDTNGLPTFANGYFSTTQGGVVHTIPIINPSVPFGWHIYKNNTSSPAVYYVANSTGYVRNSTNYPWAAVQYCLTNLAKLAINGNVCYVHTGFYDNEKDSTWHTINMVGGTALLLDKGVMFQVPSGYTGNFISFNDTNRATFAGIGSRPLITEQAPQSRLWNCISMQSSHGGAGTYFNDIEHIDCDYPNSVIQFYENSTSSGSFVNDNRFSDISSNFPRIFASYNMTVAYQNGNGFHNDVIRDSNFEDAFSATYPTTFGIKDVCCTQEQFINDVWNDEPAGFTGVRTSSLNNDTLILGGNIEPIIDNGKSIVVLDSIYNNLASSPVGFKNYTANPTADAGAMWYRSDQGYFAYKTPSTTRQIVDLSLTQILTNKILSTGTAIIMGSSTLLEDVTDNTKKLIFNLANIPTGHTDTWTWPNANDTVYGQPLINDTAGHLGGNATGTTSTALVMMGNYATFTPQQDTRVEILVSGYIQQATAGDGCKITIQYGTSNLGANGAALAGTLVGNHVDYVTGATTANQQAPYEDSFVLTGLTAGTKYYFDNALATKTGGTCTLFNINWILKEV